MWPEGWRARFQAVAEAGVFDALIVGGGITGAGVALEAARAGLRVALVEQNDFASGTSSASSKLVHGGLRYLAAGDWRLTRESVRERQRLLRELPGLVEPIDFMLPVHAGDRPGRLKLGLGLAAYDLMAGRRSSRRLDETAFAAHMPYLRATGRSGGFVYRDAVTDDVRLTLRVLQAAMDSGLQAANYVRAERLCFESDRAAAATVVDRISGARFRIRARCVVNATGPWSDRLHGEAGAAAQLRPLRGSHFVFPFHALPVARAVTLFHPDDGRPLFAMPWRGAALFGTTDLDHDAGMDEPWAMSVAESDYLIAAVRHHFPALALRPADARSSFAGVRPVVRGAPGAAASDESRESAIETHRGLVTVTGGKLTTFRVTARAALARIGDVLGRRLACADAPLVADMPGPATRVRSHGPAFARQAARGDTADRLGDSDYPQCALRHALVHEAVEHLDDLMLRRTRLGLLLAGGGVAELAVVGALCRDTLGWDAARWAAERERYLDLWRQQHAPVRT